MWVFRSHTGVEFWAVGTLYIDMKPIQRRASLNVHTELLNLAMPEANFLSSPFLPPPPFANLIWVLTTWLSPVDKKVKEFPLGPGAEEEGRHRWEADSHLVSQWMGDSVTRRTVSVRMASRCRTKGTL